MRFDTCYEVPPFIQCPCSNDLLLIKCFLERRSLYIDTALTSHLYWWPGQVTSAWPCGQRLHSYHCSRHLNAPGALFSSYAFIPKKKNSDTILSESVMWKRDHVHHPATGRLPFSKCILFHCTWYSALTGKYKSQSERWVLGSWGSHLPRPSIVE